MQWLTLIPENSTIQRLQSDYRRPAVTRAVDTLTPCAPARPVGPQTDPASALTHRHDRRKGGDRRRRQVPVLLDTRCNPDRRRSDTRVQHPPAARTRIDLYA